MTNTNNIIRVQIIYKWTGLIIVFTIEKHTENNV